jgi:hypothetical protein
MDNSMMIRGDASTQMMTQAERDALVVARARALKEDGVAYTPFEGGIQYLRVDGNTGAMSYGRDANEVPQGQRFVAPYLMAEHGYLNWQGGKITDRKMGKVLNGPVTPPPPGEPRVGTLPKPYERDGWSSVIVIRLVGLGGEMDKVEVEVDCGNDSKRRQGKELLAAMNEVADSPLGVAGFYNPVVELGLDSYRHKTYGKDIYFPTFDIIGWTNGKEIKPVTSKRVAAEPGNELLD